MLAMARKEFNVDERRTYLMGHGMGGAGTLFLAKYASNWAAVAAIAPAADRMEWKMDSILTNLTIPGLVIQGDADTVVPVENTRKVDRRGNARHLRILQRTEQINPAPISFRAA